MAVLSLDFPKSQIIQHVNCALPMNHSWLISGFMLASGAAALIYQLVWARLLSLSIGSTSAAIAIVIAAFFLGLALGAWPNRNFLGKQSNSINHYFVLEAIIGLSSLALLPILLNLDAFLAQWSHLSSSMSFKFIVVMFLLGIPTTCIGATFPVMASLFSQQVQKTGMHLGQLYGLNTAGGVLGAGLGGFLLIPNFGLDGSTYIAVSLNFIIVVIGLLGKKRFLMPLSNTNYQASVQNKVAQNNSLKITDEDVVLRKQAMFVLFITGMVALACEVGWTKYLAVYTHTTIYGFAIILVVFLTGIAIGAWVINQWLKRMVRPQIWIINGLLLLSISLILTQFGLNSLPELHEIITGSTFDKPLATSNKYSLVFILLIFPTFLFGALFTLNLHLVSCHTNSLRQSVGKAYAINTCGGLIGALSAGFWLIPEFGTHTVLILATIMCLLTIIILLVSMPKNTTCLRKSYQLIIGGVICLLLFINIVLPPLDFRKVIVAAAYYSVPNRPYENMPTVFVQEGHTGVISVNARGDNYYVLRKDGLPETYIDRNDSDFLFTANLLGLFPYLLHNNPKKAFVIGLGGGTTTRALTLTDLESIRVVELEPAVLAAGRVMYGKGIPALQDSRVELTIDDARQRLLIEERQYDLIVSQPSYPWLAGNSKLFSREFFSIARSRLTENGIFVQWLNIDNMDSLTLQSILKAFYSNFPYGICLSKKFSGGMLIFGAQQSLEFDYSKIQSRMNQASIKNILSRHNINEPQDLFRYYMFSREEALVAAGGVIANSDLNLFSEVQLANLQEKPIGDENPHSLIKKYSRFDLAAYFEKDELETRYREFNRYFKSSGDNIKARHAEMQLQKMLVGK